ncbi:MAG: acetyltransferase, partial [Gammaproteobacteria bacterium]|nr:acetyltransferase [Gammaproteobacteria bacterium]
MGNPVTNLAELLQTLRPALNEGVCVFASVSPDTDTRSLEPIATFREAEGLTLIVEEQRALKAG